MKKKKTAGLNAQKVYTSAGGVFPSRRHPGAANIKMPVYDRLRELSVSLPRVTNPAARYVHFVLGAFTTGWSQNFHATVIVASPIVKY